jgi:triacylglycerol lipase
MVSTTFDTGLATSLAELVEKAYDQYKKGLTDPTYDGKITPPKGFEQIAAFKAPEIDIGSRSTLLRSVQGSAVDLTDTATLQAMTVGVRDVFFGFALRPKAGFSPSPAKNILVFRGTQSAEEWLADLSVVQVDVPLVWFNDGKLQLAKAHLGFLLLYAFLYEQVLTAAKGFDTSLPCYCTGHSLGHPLASFAALTTDLQVYGGTGLEGLVQLYTYAGPRVGDPTFAAAFDGLIPAGFRVVNLSDVVPVVPPTSIFGYLYQHMGQEWSYLFQTGNVDTNHSLLDNYIPAVSPPTGPVETDAPRSYPTSGL